MTTLDAKQAETARDIVGQVKALRPGRDALWQLSGAVGAGKTTVLRRISEQLPSHGFVPIYVSAPSGEIDSAPIALIETARQLIECGLLNGEVSGIADPRRRWAEKLAMVTSAVDRRRVEVVLLCDEPTRWNQSQESLLDDSPESCAPSIAQWMVEAAECRRIVSGWIPEDVAPAGMTSVPRLDDGRDLLASENAWGDLWSFASALRETFEEPVPDRSPWEIKLHVARVALSDPNEAVQVPISDATSSGALLRELLDFVQRNRSDSSYWPSTLVKLALARTELGASVVAEFTSLLGPTERSVIEKCFLNWNGGRAALHPLVRKEALTRASETRHSSVDAAWKLSKSSFRAAHDRLEREYRAGKSASLRDSVESLHHELLGTCPDVPESDARIHFVEQLGEIGRTLSRVHHEHRRAAELFRLATRLDPAHAYSHHYLAFNLDWLAEEPYQVEAHYKKAIELQPTHPWRWSRWISYLATRGRTREARLNWRAAVDALSISEDGSPDWIFLSLHRWVARWLLHWAELDFAEEVLRSIPKTLAENEMSIQTLWDLLKALRQAAKGVSVFPLSVPAKEWRSPSPHTDLPPSWDGHLLRDWFPARVEGVDPENAVAFLIAAKRPSKTGASPVYFEIELTRDQVEKSAFAFEWADLHEGAFVELGFYGEGDERTCIGLHRQTTWDDPNLLPLVPPPDRWYRRAVEAAWSETAETD